MMMGAVAAVVSAPQCANRRLRTAERRESCGRHPRRGTCMRGPRPPLPLGAGWHGNSLLCAQPTVNRSGGQSSMCSLLYTRSKRIKPKFESGSPVLRRWKTGQKPKNLPAVCFETYLGSSKLGISIMKNKPECFSFLRDANPLGIFCAQLEEMTKVPQQKIPNFHLFRCHVACDFLWALLVSPKVWSDRTWAVGQNEVAESGLWLVEQLWRHCKHLLKVMALSFSISFNFLHLTMCYNRYFMVRTEFLVSLEIKFQGIKLSSSIIYHKNRRLVCLHMYRAKSWCAPNFGQF